MKQEDVNELLERPAPNDALTRRAFRIIERWMDWARAHGHLDHAEGIVYDSLNLLAENDLPRAAVSIERLTEGQPAD